jgi:DNA repair protein RecO (recombination protein O)
MSRTQRLTGINLKAIPFGESDRMLTILSPEQGLLRLNAPGARKQNSRLGGRSNLFVINDMLIAKGKSIAKITQAETLESYPGLARHLAKLTASQYLAEIALHQALNDQPQPELYYLLTEHLSRLERASETDILPSLTQAIYQLLALAGVAPQVQQCCISNQILNPDLEAPGWQAGFSIEAGGAIDLPALAAQLSELADQKAALEAGKIELQDYNLVRESISEYRVVSLEQLPSRQRRNQYSNSRTAQFMITIDAIELYLMQQLAQEVLPQVSDNAGYTLETLQDSWRRIERLLRQYAQFYLDRPIRSAALIDRYFAPNPTP